MITRRITVLSAAAAILLASCASQPPANQAAISSHFLVDPQLAQAGAAITEAEVNAAQQAWGDALVMIGKIHEDGGDAKAYAQKVLSDAYNYDFGQVFFKPTLAYGPRTFRNTKEGALSYFVGGNPAFPEDMGFALRPWVKVRFDNAGEGNNGVQIYGDIAITMGNVWLTDKQGNEIMVDKTFVFKKGADGKLRLIVHKSALPYDPAKSG